jgi:adenylate kinase family enzyme
MTLDDLGPRICIMGPSNSGKSTLAVAIVRAQGVAVVHLDQLHHLPHTEWLPRPKAEFAALHDAAIADARWVVDGNYSSVLPQRLARATGLILLDVTIMAGLVRYVRRCWFEPDRRGALAGADDRVNLQMLHYIVTTTRRNRRRHRQIFDDFALAKLRIDSPGALAAFYRANGLQR